MTFIKSIIALCVTLMLSVASAEDIIPETRTFLWCSNSYVCPANSYRIPHRWCYDDFDDCACNYGYYKSHWEHKCIPLQTTPPCKNDFVCPANSYRLPYRACYDTFDDCECNHGFFKSPSGEVKCFPFTKAPTKAPVKPPTNSPTKAPVKPPTNSPTKNPTQAPITKAPTKAPVKPPTKVPTRAPRSMSPTRAPRTMSPTRAPRTKSPTKAPVKPPTKVPTKAPVKAPVPVAAAPVKAPINCNYKCPINSHPKPDRGCYDQFDDCQCNGGYIKLNGVCVRKYH